MADASDIETPAPWAHPNSKTYPYSPSASSTTSFSSTSGSSIDAPSLQSSASSVSAEWTSSTHAENQYYFGRDSHQNVTSESMHDGITSTSHALCSRSNDVVVDSHLRQHPRRTQRFHSSESQDSGIIGQCSRPPPSLVRQSERKDNFVDSLVDTTTQMIETIWPLSVVSCARDSELNNKQQSLIGLRTFVQEVLRRSKTSYSTLQVALYYLVLIQSCIPKHDFTMEQSEDSSVCRAMQCGRRMFLSALILASKYLQDRNFSARAWSKISGLRTCEINTNEMAFLAAVNWKLHIPESLFHRWTDIVMRYSPSAQVHTSSRRSSCSIQTWKTVIPLLTPDLDMSEFGGAELSDDSGYSSPGSDMSPPPIPISEKVDRYSGSNEPTPTGPYTIPEVLEPTPRDSKTNEQILPPLPRLGLLPTPNLTPQTSTFCTPAVSASGRCHRRPSMSLAIGRMRDSSLVRSTLDNPTDWRPRLPEPFPTSARRSSLACSVSSMSSPESMISDVSSQSSRSSSISSIASSHCALPQPRLAVQATRRCANLQLSGLKEETQPTVIHASPERGLSWDEEFEAFHETGKPNPFTKPTKVNHQTEYTASTREAAVALQDLALNRKIPAAEKSYHSRPRKGLKRSRPNSMDLSVQATVRDLIAPRCLGDITNARSRNEDDRKILVDEKVADSFLLRNEENGRPLSSHDANKKAKPSVSSEGLIKKRTCAGSDRGGREEARMIERIVRGRDGVGLGALHGLV